MGHVQRIGPYSVLEEIARGGFGAVYRAQAPQGQLVALKLLHAHHTSDDDVRRRFQAEVNALARLRHPGVVQILGAGQHQGCPWLALEFVQGETLGARLHKGPLSIEAAVSVVQQLSAALAYVHTCGLLHRDLKPDNVLLCGDRALLTDFGLVLDADASTSRITATGVLQGTPGYWAPEQAKGQIREFGAATDIYGLGAVLYACLTGRPPLLGHSLQANLTAMRLHRVSPPRQLRPEVPKWLDALCMHCLQAAPAARPASADYVARTLLRADSAGSAQARPTRALLVAWLALAALVGAGTAGWVYTSPNPTPPSASPGQRAEHAEQPAAGTTAEPSVLQQAEAHVNRGREHNAANRHAEAIEEYDRALKLDPKSVVAYANRGRSKIKLGRHAEALRDLDQAIQLDPTETPSNYFVRGACNYFLDRTEPAIRDLDKAIELGSQTGQAYILRGTCKLDIDLYKEALADLDRGIQLKPDRAKAYSARGMCHMNLGQFEAALEDFETAVELAPRNAKFLARRGAAKAAVGRNLEALEDYTVSLTLGRRVANTYANRASSYAQLGREAEAIDDLNKAIELAPQDSAYYRSRGRSKAALGRHAEAIKDYDAALRLQHSPRDAERLRRFRAESAAQLKGTPR